MSYHHHGNSWTERTAAQDDPAAGDRLVDLEHHARSQGYAHQSLGFAGHVVHMGAMLFPVLAAELINDAVKYKKAVRIGSVVTTVLYEGLYAAREARRRDRQDAKLAECRESHSHER